MFQIDLTKNQISENIRNNQSYLNAESTRLQRRNRGDFIGSRKQTKRKSREDREMITKNLAGIQRNQIELKELGIANDVIKERIQDENNLIQWGAKFPYGKENVDISEDVLERYRGNYDQQAQMLQKFRREAELQRMTAKAKKRPISTKWQMQLRTQKNNDAEMERMRRTLRQEMEESERWRKMQQDRIKQIGEMLENLSTQLHSNSYMLDKGLRDLEKRLKKRQNKSVEDKPKRPAYKDILDLVSISKKIPIVTYRDQPCDARLYFSDVYKSTQKTMKPVSSELPRQDEGYRQVMNILHENNRRLEYLNKYSKQDSPLLRYK